MNVSEIARSVGIAPSAVRFYERRGILPRPSRLAAGDTDPDLCLAKRGDRDDQLRLRTRLPMSANARLPVLTHSR